MDKLQKQLTAFLKNLTAGQIFLLVGSTAVIGLTVWFFVQLLGGAGYTPLYTGLAPADAQSLAQRLTSENIDYQISTDGATVSVPSDQLDKARLDVASQGPLASGRMGFELFDKPNWSGSDFSEKVNYQRALEAELERTISTMNGVEAVRVHLVLPRDSIFTDQERPAKAAVVLKLRGMRMSDQVAGSIANLVASAWDDLSPDNVTVITTDGQTAGHSQAGDGPNGMADLETAMAERVVQVLTPVVGADHVKSSVTIEYDPTSADSTEDLYDPATSAVLTSQVSQESAADLQPSGIPGTPSNAPNTPPAGAAAAANQGNADQATQGIHTENKTYAVSHTTKHLVEPAGRIKRLAAAVLVDDVVDTKDENGKTTETRRKRTPEEMAQITDLSKAALGWDMSRGDQISVQDVTFRLPPEDQPVAPTTVERVRNITEQWTGLLRYAGLLVLFVMVYFLVLNPIKNRVVAAIDSVQVRISTNRPQLEAAEAGGAAALPGQLGNNRALPEGSAQMSPEFQRAIALKQQIATKVKSEPEEASRLVQGWLREGGA